MVGPGSLGPMLNFRNFQTQRFHCRERASPLAGRLSQPGAMVKKEGGNSEVFEAMINICHDTYSFGSAYVEALDIRPHSSAAIPPNNCRTEVASATDAEQSANDQG